MNLKKKKLEEDKRKTLSQLEQQVLLERKQLEENFSNEKKRMEEERIKLQEMNAKELKKLEDEKKLILENAAIETKRVQVFVDKVKNVNDLLLKGLKKAKEESQVKIVGKYFPG